MPKKSRSIKGTVRAKTIHGAESHSYLIVWPDPKGGKTPIGRWFWDYGVANRGVISLLASMFDGISFCRRVACQK